MEQYFNITLWVLFALVTGITEAFFFNKNQKHFRLKGKDIHFWFTISRMIVAAPMVIVILIGVGWLEAILFSVIIIVCFPFFHDGAYYTTRELLKKGTYPLYWADQSKKTSAKYSYNIVIRTIGLIIALLLFPY